MFSILFSYLYKKRKQSDSYILKSVFVITDSIIQLIESGSLNEENKINQKLLSAIVQKNMCKYDLDIENLDCNMGCLLLFSFFQDIEITVYTIQIIGSLYKQNMEQILLFSQLCEWIEHGCSIEEILEMIDDKHIVLEGSLLDCIDALDNCNSFEETIGFMNEFHTDEKTDVYLSVMAEEYFGIPEKIIIETYKMLDGAIINLLERYYITVFEQYDLLDELSFAVSNYISTLRQDFANLVYMLIADSIEADKSVYVIRDSKQNNEINISLKAAVKGSKHYYFCFTHLKQIQSVSNEEIFQIPLYGLIKLILNDPDCQALIINPEKQGMIIGREILSFIFDQFQNGNVIN